MKTALSCRLQVPPPPLPPLLLLLLLVAAASSSSLNRVLIDGGEEDGERGGEQGYKPPSQQAADYYYGYVALKNPHHYHLDLHYHGIHHSHQEQSGDYPALGLNEEVYGSGHDTKCIGCDADVYVGADHGGHESHGKSDESPGGIYATPGGSYSSTGGSHESRGGSHHSSDGSFNPAYTQVATHYHDGSDSPPSNDQPGNTVLYADHERTEQYTPKMNLDFPGPHAHTHDGRHRDHHDHDPAPCASPRQSPININTCNVQRQVNSRLSLKNFGAYPTRFSVTNTGKDVMGFMTWQGQVQPTVSGGTLPGTFTPFAIDFHWGKNDSFGSEHTINGGRYQLEGHIQCRNIKYGTVQEALGNVDGLAVLAVLFSLQPDSSGGRGLTALAESLSQIREVDTTVEVAGPPSMASFLPNNLADRVEYTGSLTGAPFSEVVHWVVMLTPARVLAPELSLLRDLRKQGGAPIGDTFRSPRARCGRILYRSGYKQLLERCTNTRVAETPATSRTAR